MSSENWKLENDLCRCCHSEGSFKNLAEPFKVTDFEEIYADMLKECYNIDMAPVPGMLSAVTYTICEVCVIRLRDASDFKKQVLSCEERFKDMYNRNVLKAAVCVEVEVKQETIDSEPDDFKDDFPQPGIDDEEYDESMDLHINEEADEKPVEVRKKRKYKTRSSVKSTSLKTKKRTKEKKLKEEPTDTENDTERKQDRVVAPLLSPGRVVAPLEPASRVVPPSQSANQDVAPKFRLKDEDYKKNGEEYQCGRCDRTYKTYDTLRCHVKSKHYKITRYKCSICTEEFFSLAPLAVHKLKVHKIDDRFECNACNKMFNTKRQLTNHINFFHMLGEVGQRYKCELCDFETFRTLAMYKHKIKHTAVKNYHCRFCKKSFKRKTTLNCHERIHTGDRRKVCAVCGQAFVQKASLNYHMTKYHPGVNF